MATNVSLCEAVQTGELKKVVDIIQRNPKKLNKVNDQGQTPLYCACKMGSAEIVLHLLLQPNVALAAQVPSTKSTPLHTAAWNNHPEVVALLLWKGSPTDIKNGLDWTAKQEAKKSCKQVFELWEAKKFDTIAAKYPIVLKLPFPKDYGEVELQKDSTEGKLRVTKESRYPSETIFTF